MQAVDPSRKFTVEDSLPTLKRYAVSGCPTGDFLREVRSNDLLGAVGRADDYNLGTIPAICNYIDNEMPSGCHGSRETVETWIKDHDNHWRPA